MITDTALYPYPRYQPRYDTPEQIEYAGRVRVVTGIERMVADSAENVRKRTLPDLLKYPR